MPANNQFLQLNSPIVEIFTELGERSNAEKMKWRKPNSRVSMLHATFKQFPIRHVPIMESNPGELKALISRVDYAAMMTPPIEKLPLDRLNEKEQKDVNDFIKNIAFQPISNVFEKFFIGETEKLYSTHSILRDAIKKLSESQVDKTNNINRRYRTLPVFDDNKLLVGMLSYTNILRKIQEEQGCTPFRNKKLKEIFKAAEELTTLAGDRTMTDAAMQLDGAPFTHIPIMKADNSRSVTGIVDDLIIARYQHPLLVNCFEELSLDEIKITVGEDNTVKDTDTVGDIIDKFLTITYPERPTAIVVCQKNNSGDFVLQGIVSYTDILKKFLSWKEGNTQPQSQEKL
ncbi:MULTISPECIES: CBS domain-containing protein [Aerosakkonema]|uniref:CBS domain-containing protein n=1 Tax=Aerosakkonema TaxID=1246629 RepID=UPI0035BA1F68